MHHHGNRDRPFTLPARSSPEYRAQRVVLLELVASPPPEGDRISYLRDYLPVPSHTIAPAIAALETIGLATQLDGRVWATPAARYFEYLWPVRP